ADLEEVKQQLAACKMNVTVSRPPSTRLDMEARGLDGVVRASVHYYNTEGEVERFAQAIEDLA
ncbi:MAG TPA: hypothetical protein VKZ96_09635, partial [Thermomicrobiales bacterium]|nr:hypothetical protein [Thermomicrobiales bacterium]